MKFMAPSNGGQREKMTEYKSSAICYLSKKKKLKEVM